MLSVLLNKTFPSFLTLWLQPLMLGYGYTKIVMNGVHKINVM